MCGWSISKDACTQGSVARGAASAGQSPMKPFGADASPSCYPFLVIERLLSKPIHLRVEPSGPWSWNSAEEGWAVQAQRATAARSIYNGIHGSEQVTAGILTHCFWVQVLLHSWHMCPSWAERCEASVCALSSAWWRYASIHSMGLCPTRPGFYTWARISLLPKHSAQDSCQVSADHCCAL